METRKQLAAEKKRLNTHNCAQAVVCTYCDLCGLDEKTATEDACKMEHDLSEESYEAIRKLIH